MTPRNRVVVLLLAGVLAFVNQAARADGSTPAAQAVIGDPIALTVQPAAIHLRSARAMQQIIVTGRYGDGSERDLTSYCDLRADAADVVHIHAGGFLQPRKNGRTELVAQAGKHTTRIPVV